MHASTSVTNSFFIYKTLEFPFDAYHKEAPVTANRLYPVFLQFFRFKTGLAGLVQQIASLQIQRKFLEIFLYLGVEFAVLFENGEKGGYLTLILGIRPNAPTFSQPGGHIGIQLPVEGVLDLVSGRGYSAGLVECQSHVGDNHLPVPTQLLGKAQRLAVGGIEPMEHLVLASVYLLVGPGLVNFVGNV